MRILIGVTFMVLGIGLLLLLTPGCQHGIYPPATGKCGSVIMSNGVTQVVCF